MIEGKLTVKGVEKLIRQPAAFNAKGRLKERLNIRQCGVDCASEGMWLCSRLARNVRMVHCDFPVVQAARKPRPKRLTLQIRSPLAEFGEHIETQRNTRR